MKSIQELLKAKPWLGWIVFTITVVVVFFLGLLASSIIERRAEAVFAYTPEITFSPDEPRNEIWGEVFPREYNSYTLTADTTFRSKYNGSATVDMLEESPNMAVLWAGYLFSRDYKQGRGHYHAVEDIQKTLRTGAPVNGVPSPQPNTCWACKSPDVPRLMNKTGVAELSLIHISEPTRLLSISYAVFCLKKKTQTIMTTHSPYLLPTPVTTI